LLLLLPLQPFEVPDDSVPAPPTQREEPT
jgi:hypothetical protein